MLTGKDMNFCSNCGSPTVKKIPEGDGRARNVCEACGMIHYENPKLVVGTIPEYNEKILLCRRAIEPMAGLWTLPAGFMENSETAPEGAIRETWEEAGIKVTGLSPYSFINIPHISQMYMLFRAKIEENKPNPGSESLECALFDIDAIPWDDIAFKAVKKTLEFYVSDKKAGHFTFHMDDVIKTD